MSRLESVLDELRNATDAPGPDFSAEQFGDKSLYESESGATHHVDVGMWNDPEHLDLGVDVSEPRSAPLVTWWSEPEHPGVFPLGQRDPVATTWDRMLSIVDSRRLAGVSWGEGTPTHPEDLPIALVSQHLNADPAPSGLKAWTTQLGSAVPTLRELSQALELQRGALNAYVIPTAALGAHVWHLGLRRLVAGVVSPVCTYRILTTHADPDHEIPHTHMVVSYEGPKTLDRLVSAPTGIPAQPAGAAKALVLGRIRQIHEALHAHVAPWSDPPSDSAFGDAEVFVLAWPADALHIPDVGLADDGEVNFLWKSRDLHVDLGFYGDGTFSYYAKSLGGVEHSDDDVPAGSGLPAVLLALLKA